MISDFVKGKKQFDYPLYIQKGIKLHRAIDHFTDNHEATKQLNQFFKNHYRLYSGAFTDIVYDYFLANDKNEFASVEILMRFTHNSYQALEKNINVCPLKFQQIFPHMQHHNWLYNYRYELGIQRSFGGLAARAAYINNSDIAFDIFKNNLAEMKKYYDLFFPSLKKFAADTLQQLLNK